MSPLPTSSSAGDSREDPGKVLVVGDLHGNGTHARTLLRIAARRGCRAVFALGDFGAVEHTRAGRRYFDHVDRAAARHDLTVYFLDGNHDNAALLLTYYRDVRDADGFLRCRNRIRYAPRGHRWTWNGTRFAAFGGAYSVDKPRRLAEQARRAARARRHRRPPEIDSHTLWFPDEQMTDDDLKTLLAADSAPVDILLTHDKPRAAQPDHNRKTAPECLPNQDRIQLLVDTLHPALLLHGHLHYRYTDLLTGGTGRPTRVEGLAADPDVSWHPGYHPRDSWLELPLPYPPHTAGA
ncbi:metallophosphoesterase family protein [Nocardia mexicana]|uniref:Calcineurin-like phosphoesterase family protein n=1 Tax=Nocardia mexicana TaxID=279262 RepID=A0A370GTM5_9NOCA|nr:metallophosphoesterase [Nocardia mexicana]RDI45273.1 calcineurin-like phosphoesterase family protein [Nocardia mexicana]